MPAGFTADGLPVGMDLLGLPFGEAALLKAAYAYERSVAPRRPPARTPPLTRSRRPAQALSAASPAAATWASCVDSMPDTPMAPTT